MWLLILFFGVTTPGWKATAWKETLHWLHTCKGTLQHVGVIDMCKDHLRASHVHKMGDLQVTNGFNTKSWSNLDDLGGTPILGNPHIL
jgi:hypothetical protein